MPKTKLFGVGGHSGVSITWTKTRSELYIDGWYDSIVGIPGESVTLKDFFQRLGITEKDCRKAFYLKY
jgi:hypothetical protein